ncbi:MAG: hypothetical protein IJ711_10115 [Lachnospiraceae bacterium]|nr:hypothetical protein [Lachnospiraceae bacterium]
MTFLDLPSPAQGVQCVWNLMLLLTYVLLMMRCVFLKRKAGMHVAAALGFLIGALLNIYMVGAERFAYEGAEVVYPERLLKLPEPVLICLLSAMSVTAALLLLNLNHFSRNQISSQSVKEAMDLLPSGVCYYDSTGRILLVNQTMNDIHRSLTGYTVLDGKDFWNRMKAGRDGQIVQTADGRVYSFVRNEIVLDAKPVFELIASDITEEYRLSRQLSDDNERLREYGAHLRSVGNMAGEVTIVREILDAKVRIHDNLGSGLILAKRYLSSASEDDREALLDVWRKNIRLLQNELQPPETGDYHALLKAAEDVGVHIQIEGRLPEDETGRRLTSCAIDECITNTFRHAQGDALFIRVVDSEQKLIFTNNGIRPSAPIQETGGLKNLRQLVESAGGRLEVADAPAFALTLHLPPHSKNPAAPGENRKHSTQT